MVNGGESHMARAGSSRQPLNSGRACAYPAPQRNGTSGTPGAGQGQTGLLSSAMDARRRWKVATNHMPCTELPRAVARPTRRLTMVAPVSLTHHAEAILDRPNRASIDLTVSKVSRLIDAALHHATALIHLARGAPPSRHAVPARDSSSGCRHRRGSRAAQTSDAGLPT